MSREYFYEARVYFEDTDAGGIVYYANYLKFCERARTEWLRGSGLSQSTLLESGEGFVVRYVKGKYLRSARLDDLLRISVVPFKVGKCGLKILQRIYNQNNELLFEFECALAYVDLRRSRPRAMPGDAREYIRPYVGDEQGVTI